MDIRAKFQLQEHRQASWGGDHRQHTFIFRPMYDDTIPEDRRFAQASPSGEMSITVDNPPVVEYWTSKLGQQFYLDFTPVNRDADS